MTTPLELARMEVRRRVRQACGLELTAHAIDRMGEMGVSADALCRIVRDGSSWPQASRVSGRRGQLHWHPDHPAWAAVTADDDPDLVITVVFRSIDEYERDGAGYTVR